jgi:arylsulfatase A
MLPLLTGRALKLPREAIFWHYPHYHGSGHRPSGALRLGDLKLIEFFEDMNLELYNLREDLSERQDLAVKLSGKAAELRSKLHEWRRSLNASMPERA